MPIVIKDRESAELALASYLVVVNEEPVSVAATAAVLWTARLMKTKTSKPEMVERALTLARELDKLEKDTEFVMYLFGGRLSTSEPD